MTTPVKPSFSLKTSQILEYLQTCQGGMTISDLARITGFSRNTITKYLERLSQAGLVEMQSIGPAKYYSITPVAGLYQIAEHLPDPVVIINSSSIVRFANNAYCCLYYQVTGQKDLPTKARYIPGLPEREIITGILRGSFQVQVIQYQGKKERCQFRTTCVPVTLEKGEKGALFYILNGDHTIIGGQFHPEWIAALLSSLKIPAVICRSTDSGENGEIIAFSRTAAPILGIDSDKKPNQQVPIHLTGIHSLESFTDLSGMPPDKIRQGTPYLCRLAHGEEFILNRITPAFPWNDETYHIMTFPDPDNEETGSDSFSWLGTITSRLISLFHSDLSKSEIWHAMAMVLQEVFPGSIIISNISIDPNTWICQSVVATYAQKATIQEILGHDPVGVSYTISDLKKSKILSKKVMPATTGISAAFFHVYPTETCKRLTEELAVHQSLIMPLLFSDNNSAYITVLLPYTTTLFLKPALIADIIVPLFQMTFISIVSHIAQIDAEKEKKSVEFAFNNLKEKYDTLHREKKSIITDYSSIFAQHNRLFIDLIPLLSLPAVLIKPTGMIIQINYEALSLIELAPQDILLNNWYDIISARCETNYLYSHHEKIRTIDQAPNLILQPIKTSSGFKNYIWAGIEILLPEPDNSGILWVGEEIPALQIIRFSKGL